MSRKQKTIAEVAKERTFESIYEEQNKLKIQRAVIQKDIDGLVRKRNGIITDIGRLTRIAAEKRKGIVDKK